jgi:membrane protein YqaA with SNARE-associated domain
MASSSINPPEPHTDRYALPDNVSVLRWFLAYGVSVGMCLAALLILIARQDWSWSQWTDDFPKALRETDAAIKLLVMVVYLSVCTAFLPLPTGWLIACVAMREAAVGPEVWTTTLLVAVFAAFGSTIANLNEYHLVTWMLRHHRLAAVRHTRTHQAAERWFARSPFLICVIFNIIPIPIDVVRMIATSCRYARVPFAAANFVGRFVRYGVIAFVTYYWDLGWIAVVVLLGVAVVLGAWRLGPPMVRKLLGRSSPEAAQVSEPICSTEEPTL